jgi:hypothetical protein
MTSFEVQRFYGGDWRLHSTFEDKALAIEAAKELMSGNRAPAAVRVVEDRDDGTPLRTVFRRSSVDEHNLEARRQQVVTEREVAAQRVVNKDRRARERREQAELQRRRARWRRAIARVVLVAAAGYGLYIAWRYGIGG